VSDHTPLPWVVEPGPDGMVWVLSEDDEANEGNVIAETEGPDRVVNAAFIARACNLHERMRDMLRRVEGLGPGGDCPVCGCTSGHQDHHSDCELAALLRDIDAAEKV